MKFGIKTLDDFDFGGKKVVCRVDFNQPVDRASGTLKSTARIEAAAPTVRELLDAGAAVVLLAHQGSDIEYDNYWTTEPHAAALSRILGREVLFVPDVCGPAALDGIRALRPGQVMLLDNVRFIAEEQTLFETSLRLSHERQARTLLPSRLAPLFDIYVCDAFAAAHRDQPSLCGFEQILPSAMGRLFEREYCVVSELLECPARPCVFVLGGAKVSDAFLMLQSVLPKGGADSVLTGGVVANIFLLAKGEKIGSGSADFVKKSGYWDFVGAAKEILERHAGKIALPADLAWLENGARREGKIGEIPAGAAALDIGSETAKIYREKIMGAKTVFANGPMGVFEKAESEAGTKSVWDALGETEARTVVGGGDSIAATAKYGKTEAVSYVCTGGGALIRFLSGEELPVVRALRHGAKIDHNLSRSEI